MGKGTTKGMMTATQLAAKYGVSEGAVRHKMKRHGFKANAKKQYRESEYVKADAAGREADKAEAAKQLAEVEAEGKGDTLQARILRKKIELLDVDIATAKHKLDEMRGKMIAVDEHLRKLEHVGRIMVNWWDKAAENIATKRKDAELLAALRDARDRAMNEMRNNVE